MENYINKTEPCYRWQLTEVSNDSWGAIGHYKLVSQNWRGHDWIHHLIIARPVTVRNPDIAFLKISGDGDFEEHINSLKTLAERSGAVTAVIMNVPNQPFYGGRCEDALIIYTFKQYLKTGDDTWPLLFPMVKSAIKAMDAIQDIIKLEYKQQINRFVVNGASKRGWTTWLTAAVDKRISAIAPMVIGTFNIKAQLHSSEQIYGKETTHLKDYTELNLHRKNDSETMQKLRGWIDPYAYIERYTMPKLLLLGTNDPYWTVDSLRHYWHDLPEPKLIYQTPNAGHDLNGGDQALQTLAAFLELIADQKPLPQITWQFNDVTSTRINAEVQSNEPAYTMSLWSADSENQDFRNNLWTAKSLNISSEGNQSNTIISIPPSGYRAYLMEVELKTDTGHPYKLSTQVQVTPGKLPRDC